MKQVAPAARAVAMWTASPRSRPPLRPHAASTAVLVQRHDAQVRDRRQPAGVALEQGGVAQRGRSRQDLRQPDRGQDPDRVAALDAVDDRLGSVRQRAGPSNR